MRKDEIRIEAGYLRHCAPQAAYDWLVEHLPPAPSPGCPRPRRHLDVTDGRKLLEYLLFRRRDRLIDLGLARFGEIARIVRRVYARGDIGVRCAAWGNEFAVPDRLTERGWFTEREIIQLVTTAPQSELIALAANPAIDDDLAVELIGRKGIFAGLTDSAYQSVLVTLGTNPRLATQIDLQWDGFADYRYHNVFQAAWDLTRTLPVTQEWAAYLDRLLQKCVPPSGFKDLDMVLARWRIDKVAEEDKKDRHHWPGYSFYLRSRLADLRKADASLLASDDKALRLSFYRRFAPSAFPDWATFFDKDGEDFVEAALENEALWRSSQSRERLRDLAWKVPDPSHDMLVPARFSRLEERWQKERPAWFEAGASDGDGTPTILERMEHKLDTIMGSVTTPSLQRVRQISPIVWIVIGAIGVLLLQRFGAAIR